MQEALQSFQRMLVQTLDYNDLARTIVKASKGTGKAMLAALMGLAEGTENKEILSDGGIPHFMYAEPAIETLHSMYKFSNWLSNPIGQTEYFDVDKKKVKSVLDNVIQQQRTNLIEEEGYEILNAYGFPTPRSILATSENQC